MTKSFIYIIIIAILITLLNSSNNNIYDFVNLGDWLNLINNSTDFYKYENNYCIKNQTILTNNSFICTKYIEPIYTKVNFTELNINSIKLIADEKKNSIKYIIIYYNLCNFFYYFNNN